MFIVCWTVEAAAILDVVTFIMLNTDVFQLSDFQYGEFAISNEYLLPGVDNVAERFRRRQAVLIAQQVAVKCDVGK